MVDESCKGCKYLGVLSRCPYCSYSDVTGHSRGCSSGKGCTVREAGKNANAPSYFAFHHTPKQQKKKPAKPTKEKKTYTELEFAEHESIRKKEAAERNRALMQGKQRKALLDYKKTHGLTTQEMAAQAGVGTSTLNRWMTEYALADWEKLSKLGIVKPDF